MKIAVSFAGEDREFVNSVVDGIKLYLKTNSSSIDLGLFEYGKSAKSKNIIFYDNDFISELSGSDLINLFQKIYGRYDLVFGFVNSFYLNKEWTNLEQSIIKERLLKNRYRESFFIPIKLDNSLLDFYPNYMGYINGVDHDAQRIIDIICSKIEGKQINQFLERPIPENSENAYQIFCKDLSIFLDTIPNSLGNITIFDLSSKNRRIIVRNNCYGLKMFSIECLFRDTKDNINRRQNMFEADFLCYIKNGEWVLSEIKKVYDAADYNPLNKFNYFYALVEALIPKLDLS